MFYQNHSLVLHVVEIFCNLDSTCNSGCLTGLRLTLWYIRVGLEKCLNYLTGLITRCSLLLRPSYVMKEKYKLRENKIKIVWISVLVALALTLTARLLVTSVSLIYLVVELFIFPLLVLLKQMRTRGESISSCCFCV